MSGAVSSSAPLHDAGGVIIGGVSVFQDISLIAQMERRQAEILAQSEAALRRLQAVQAVTDTALAHLPAQALLQQLLARVAQTLSVDNAALLLVSEDAESLVVHVARGVEEAQVGEVLIPIGEGIAGRIAATRRHLIVDDVRSVDVANPLLQQTARSLVGVPVLLQDRLLGVLHAESAVPRRFTTEDVEVLQFVAERIGLVVDNSRLFGELRQRSADLVLERDQLARILEVLPVGGVIYDADARIVAINGAAQTLVGATATAALVGEHNVDPTSTPTGRLLFNVLAAIAQFETGIRAMCGGSTCTLRQPPYGRVITSLPPHATGSGTQKQQASRAVRRKPTRVDRDIPVASPSMGATRAWRGRTLGSTSTV
jgi:GAF domain-containing protein